PSRTPITEERTFYDFEGDMQGWEVPVWALGKTDRADEAAQAILVARPLDRDAWATRLDIAVHRADYAAVREMLAGEPFGSLGSVALQRLAAAALLRIGDADAAIDLLTRLAAERPADSMLRIDLGRALPAAGRDDAAAAGLASPSAGDLAHWWIATGGKRIDGDGMLGRWAEIDAEGGGADTAVWVFRGIAVRIEADGTVRRLERRALLVGSGGAAAIGERKRIVLAVIDPARTAFRLARGLVRKPDGATAGHAGLEWSRATRQGAHVFDEHRTISLGTPRLEPGDLVEIEFETVDPGAGALPTGAAAIELPVLEVHPTRLLRIAVDAPDGVDLRVDPPRGFAWRSSERSAGGRPVRVWEVADLPAVPIEPLGPPLREVAGAFRLTTFTSWDDVAGWFARLFRAPADDARIAAAATRKNLAAIHRFVAGSIRYVSIAYGDRALRPSPPAATLARGYGDCKDKTALLAAMLAVTGVRARVALVRTRLAGADPSDGAFPYPFAFDHVIAYLPPPIDRFVDPTAARLPWDVLPRIDRGAPALVLGGDGEAARLVRIPDEPPPGERTERRDRLFFDASGEAALLG
ncbi:MAG: DUF3857 domain-containing protein, partial [Myxococcota bacterium]|nr:DUF3857 domain-containing protein [Myxococcota bacterium]